MGYLPVVVLDSAGKLLVTRAGVLPVHKLLLPVPDLPRIRNESQPLPTDPLDVVVDGLGAEEDGAAREVAHLALVAVVRGAPPPLVGDAEDLAAVHANTDEAAVTELLASRKKGKERTRFYKNIYSLTLYR